ncbi:MAG: heavy-metal-associated domain-containing protein [Flavobacteriaceae bacterium]|nr:heavy-metal-associated domain-containing protein [Flavobacteriaceae bacterium]
MKIQKIAVIFVLAIFTLFACNNESKKPEVKQEITAANLQKVTLNVSGMTCEIGCAKTIQSKLSKKGGIASAKVIFQDSLAIVEFDPNKISKTEIIAFVDGVAGGGLYKATESTKEVKSCTKDCKKACCTDNKG